MPLTRRELLEAAQSLCADFASKKDSDTLLTHFSTTYACAAFEHGEPCLAPFLGRTFTGHEGIKTYFSLLAQVLSYEDMTFGAWCVDAEARKVCCRGAATFIWSETGEKWDEKFVYMLDFDEEGKVAEYQVWADSGAAYLARLGELSKLVCRKTGIEV